MLSSCTGQVGPVTSSGGTARAAVTDLHLADFVALDASFVSDARGFVLGSARCAGAPCVVLLGTTDGARHWTTLSRLPVAPYDDSGFCRVEARCVGSVRFATAEVGYLFGPALLMTTDGGRTWRHERGWTWSLEAASGTVLRVHALSDGCNAQPSRLESSTPGSSTWALVRTLPAERNCPPTLYRQGPSALAVVDYGNPAGTEPWSDVQTSTDGGRHLVGRGSRYDDICSRDTGHTAWVALAPGGVLVQLCAGNAATSRADDSWLRISADLGRSYRPAPRVVHGDPSYPVPTTVAAASATHLVALLNSPHVGVLQVTFDGGRYWRTTQEMPPGLRTLVGFEGANTARALDGDQIYTTTNGGRTWRINTLVAES